MTDAQAAAIAKAAAAGRQGGAQRIRRRLGDTFGAGAERHAVAGGRGEGILPFAREHAGRAVDGADEVALVAGLYLVAVAVPPPVGTGGPSRIAGPACRCIGPVPRRIRWTCSRRRRRSARPAAPKLRLAQ